MRPPTCNTVHAPFLERYDGKVRAEHGAQARLVIVRVRDAALVTFGRRERLIGNSFAASVARVADRRKGRRKDSARMQEAGNGIDALRDAFGRSVEERVRCEDGIETIRDRRNRRGVAGAFVVEREHVETGGAQRGRVAPLPASEIHHPRIVALAQLRDQHGGERVGRLGGGRFRRRKTRHLEERTYTGERRVMLTEGDKMPSVSVEDDRGQHVETTDLLGGRLVLYFYPKDDTPGCTNEASQFRDLLPQFERKKARIVGVSRDSVASHQKFKEKYSLPFELLSDVDSKLCDAFGVIVEKSNYGKTYQGIQRSTFVVDANGKIEKVWPKVTADGHAAEVLEYVSKG